METNLRPAFLALTPVNATPTTWDCPECGSDMPQFFGGYHCVNGHVVHFDTQAEADMRGWSA